MRSQDKDLGATITTHHLIINRNHILVGGIKPHYYCLPVAKREEHRIALRAAATSGDARFFLGTDSAPHTDANKLQPCGCAGCFTATNTMPLLAHVFEEEGKLENLAKFASENGPNFYRLPVNEGTLTLTKGDAPTAFPEQIDTARRPRHRVRSRLPGALESGVSAGFKNKGQRLPWLALSSLARPSAEPRGGANAPPALPEANLRFDGGGSARPNIACWAKCD